MRGEGRQRRCILRGREPGWIGGCHIEHHHHITRHALNPRTPFTVSYLGHTCCGPRTSITTCHATHTVHTAHTPARPAPTLPGRMFRTMDVDHDNKISFEEFKKALSEYDLKLSEQNVHKLFRQALSLWDVSCRL
eukprot:365692-Chlamydomonas_euryale.AAC.1